MRFSVDPDEEAARGVPVNAGDGRRRGGAFVTIAGSRMYYETHGAGAPLLLLHGGMCTVETMDRQIAGLCTAYQVFVPERRGHGRTPDVAEPFTYELMAEETAEFMRVLGIASAHVVGWSDGAMVGLQLALRRPQAVRRLVFMGQSVTLDGMPPEVVQLLSATTRAMLPADLVRGYEAVSPDGPEHLPVVVAKLRALWGRPTGVTLGDLSRLAAPTLVLVGDEDLVRLEHAVEVYRAIPRAQLGVVPGARHTMPADRPGLVNEIVRGFLAESPETAPV